MVDMSDVAARSLALKEEGNALYKEKKWLAAAGAYSKGIKVDPDNAVLYSNRCAALIQLCKVTKALQDAEMAIKLRPTWGKGFYRKGAALEGAGKLDEALSAYREAAELEPNNIEFSTKIKNISRQIRVVKNKTGALPKEDQFIKSDEEYSAAKSALSQGSVIPHNVKRIEKFGREMLDDAINRFVELDGKLEPVCFFLPGRKDKDGTETIGQVNVKQAFDSPDTLANCVEFLRKYAEDMSMAAAAVVVPRGSIAYPQVWKGLGAKKWKHGDKDGFFVQLESKDLRNVWFVPSGSEKNVATPHSTHSLEPDVHRLMPPLFK